MKNKKLLKILLPLLSIIIVLGGVFVCDVFLGFNPPEIKKVSESNIKNTSDIKLIAHRGFSGMAPENSIVAFEKAAEYNFYAVECDIHLTKDGIWVVHHDNNIFRLTNGFKNIDDSTYDELQEYVIDNGVNVNEYPNQKIPTLEEYLVVCSDMKIIPQIEIKEGSKEKLSEILYLLEKYNLKEDAIIISFNSEILATMRSIDKDIDIWYLVEKINDEEINICKNNSFALAFNASKNKNDVIKTAKASGIQLCAWTVDDLDELERLYNAGVKYITTNSIIPE